MLAGLVILLSYFCMREAGIGSAVLPFLIGLGIAGGTLYVNRLPEIAEYKIFRHSLFGYVAGGLTTLIGLFLLFEDVVDASYMISIGLGVLFFVNCGEKKPGGSGNLWPQEVHQVTSLSEQDTYKKVFQTSEFKPIVRREIILNKKAEKIVKESKSHESRDKNGLDEDRPRDV